MEPRQIFLRQINAPCLKILRDVANDVCHLQGEPKIDRIFSAARISIAENFDAHQANCAGDAVTIDAKLFEGGISQDAQIHFHSGNNFLQHLWRQRIFVYQLPHIAGEQGLVRSAGAKHLAPIRQTHSFLDDAQFRRIGNVIDHAAERVENRDVAFALTA